MSSGLPSLRLPAVPHNVAVARSFVGAVLRVLEAEEREVEAARLVVSELATLLIESRAHELHIGFSEAAPRIILTVGSEADLPPLTEDIQRMVDRVLASPLSTEGQEWLAPVAARSV